MPRVAVIAGAGPAGLTAAYELLARTDIVPVVCEQTGQIGGIAQTFNYKGNRIDIGGHRFFSKNDRVMRWWFTILPLQGKPAADTAEKGHQIDYAPGGPDPETEDKVMLQRPRLSRIFFRRNFFPYPISITLSVAWRLGLLNTVLITLSYLWVQLFPRKDERFLDAFYTNRFGKRLYETFFEAYTEKVWGVPCSQIRSDWGAQRVKGLSLRRAVFHAIKDLFSSDFAKAQKERETSLITRFYYPKFGPGQMWETVADSVKERGGEVRMKTRVTGVRLEGGRVAGVTLEHVETGATEDVACDFLFSTMPIKQLIGMIHPQAPATVTEVAEGLQYRDFLTVGLLLNKLAVREGRKTVRERVPDNWIYIQEGDVRVGRVQVFNNWSPYLVADRKNHVWIGLEYFVNEGGDLWVKPDRDMIDLGIAELEKIGFVKKEDVVDACVLRVPKAYPAYFGSYDQLGTVRAFTDAIPNLFLVGRNGMHRYNNQDHSMLTAMIAVDNIVAGRSDKANVWDVNAEEEYHEEKK
ncbi:MAG: NAD(P)/FAD-dependent oxidoreductase [Candidatus Peribacteraceae bacterium]|jgi:protoporphyrinogen oxidase